MRRFAGALLRTGTLVFGGAGFSQLAAGKDVRAQYEALEKPRWAPPATVFGPVWTALYALLSSAAALTASGDRGEGNAVPRTLFALHLAANLGWSPLFFRLRRYDLAEADAIAVAALAAALCAAYAKRNVAAGCLLVPLVAWCGFAALLTGDIRRRNPRRAGD